MLKQRISVKLLSYARNDNTRRRATCDDATVGAGDENTVIRTRGPERFDTPITQTPQSVKVRDLIKLIEDDGWYHVGTSREPAAIQAAAGKRGRITVFGHPSDEVHPRTLQSVLTQAQLRR